MRIVIALSVITALFWSPPVVGQPTYTSAWEASSGQLPDSICPPWRLTDNANPENPQLSGGVLTISTSDTMEFM